MPSPFSTIDFGDFPRADLRLAMVRTFAQAGKSLPPGAADEVVDLACHAADSGMRSLLEVVDRGSSFGVQNTAIGLAASLLQSRADHLIAALKAMAKQDGAQIFEGNLQELAHG